MIYYVNFVSGYLGGRGKYYAITPFTNNKFLSFFIQFLYIECYYTPGIYADGYIVFVFPFVRLYVRLFVRSFVRNSVTFVEFASKFCVKVSQVVYISATTFQKAFIFGP